MRIEHKYDDIIKLEHHVSKTHPRMSLEARSAQFAPFSAVTGYEDEVSEVARVTENQIEVTDEIRNDINKKLSYNEEINLAKKIVGTKDDLYASSLTSSY